MHEITLYYITCTESEVKPDAVVLLERGTFRSALVDMVGVCAGSFTTLLEDAGAVPLFLHLNNQN